MVREPVLIVGTGALATLFAARLASTSCPVTILGGWREGLTALEREGARLDGVGSFPVKAHRDPAGCKGIKTALVLVKSWQTERAAGQLRRCLPEDGIALTLQNGLGNDTLLVDRLGWPRVGRGVTTLGAELLAPGLARLTGEGPVSIEDHPRLHPLQEMLQNAGFEVEVSQDVRSLIWSKLVISSAINPLTAILQVRNGDLLEIPFARKLMALLACETSSLAASQGVVLGYDNPVEAVKQVAQQTADNHSSMLQDILRGSPTEIDAINGEIVRLGRENSLPLPVNETVLSMVRALSERGKI